jgi:parallel beta-helix repeat protein
LALRPLFTTRRLLAGLAAGAVAIALLASPARADVSGCDKVASTTGADSNPGTLAQPVRSPQRLIDVLSAGQTGCFRNGTYSQDSIGFRQTSNITITSYPNERATVQGRIYILTDRVKISNLNLDGRNSGGLPSPTISGDDAVIQDNDITNGHTKGSCVHPTSYNGLSPEGVVILRNRIHDCGELPATNFDHGIYFNAKAGVIASNVIYDNASQGIVLYPAGSGTVVTSNTIDGNGEGIAFGGDGWDHSDFNLVTQNIVSNSKLRWNVEAYWEGPAGMLNLTASNCLWASNSQSYYNARGGVSDDSGFTPVANHVDDPKYVNRSGKDFRLQSNSPCRGFGAEP